MAAIIKREATTTAVILRGPILAKAIVGKYTTAIIKTYVEADGEHLSDWQCDGGFYHDEGMTEIDWDSMRLVADDEYTLVTVYGEKEGRSNITKILEVLDDDLEVVKYVE